jgi:hypothetical protein
VAEGMGLSGVEKSRYSVTEFWPNTGIGSSEFVWSSSKDKADHDGITVIDPDKILELGAVGTYGTYFDAAASGTGAFVRVFSGPVNIQWAGAMAGANDSFVFETLLSKGFSNLYVPSGILRIDNDIESSINSLTFVGDVGHTFMDFSGGGRIDLEGGLTSMPNLSASVLAGANIVNFVAAHGLSYGDVFCLYNPSPTSWQHEVGDISHDGDWMEVAEVIDSTTVAIYGHAPDTYLVGDMECYKMEGGRVYVEGINIIPSTSVNIPFRTLDHKDVTYKNFYCSTGAPDTGISATRCYDVKVMNSNSNIQEINGYAIAIVNCKQVDYFNSGTRSVRHSVLLGGGETAPGNIPTRKVRIHDSFLTNDSRLGIGAADMHGIVDDVMYTDCYLDFGANPGGRNITFNGCTIISRQDDNSAVFASASAGGLHKYNNCTIEVKDNAPSSATFGVFSYSVEKLREDFTIEVNNLTIKKRGSNGIRELFNIGFPAVTAAHDPADYNVSIIVNSLTLDVAGGVGDIFAISDTNYGGDISSFFSASLDGLNLNGTTVSRFFSNDWSVASRESKIKLPRQIITHAVDFSGADQVTHESGEIEYGIDYPRPPRAVVNFYRGGSNTLNLEGNVQPLIAYPYRVRTIDINMALIAPDLSSFGFSYNDLILVGEVWIDDFLETS